MNRAAAYFISDTRHEAGQCETPPPPPTNNSPRSAQDYPSTPTMSDESLCSESVSFFLEQSKVPNNESSRLIRPIKTYPCTRGSPRSVDYHEYHHSPVMADGNFMRSNQYPDYYDHWSPSRHNSVPWSSHDYQPFYPSSAWARDFPVDTKFDGLAHTREDYHRYHLRQHQRHELHRRPEHFYDPTPWKQPRMNEHWHYSAYSSELDDDAGLDFNRPSCAGVTLVMIEEEDLQRRSHCSGAPRRMLKANRTGLLYEAGVPELPSNYASIFRRKPDSAADRRWDEDRKALYANETIVSSESTSPSNALRRDHEPSDQDQDDLRYCLSPATTMDPDDATTTELLRAANEGSDPTVILVEPDNTKTFVAGGTLFARVDNFFKLVDQFTNCNSPDGNTALLDDDVLLTDCLNSEVNVPTAMTAQSDSCLKNDADDSNEDTGLKNQESVDYLKIMKSLKENVQLCPGWTSSERKLPPAAPVTPVSSRCLAADCTRVGETTGNTSLREPHNGEKSGSERLECEPFPNLVELDDDDSFLNSAGCVSMFIQAASNE
jgi:hypothetical protein